MDFETLPSSIDDITVEATTESIEETVIESSDIEYNDPEQKEIASLYAEYFLNEEIMIEDIIPAEQLRGSNDVSFTSSDFIFTINTGSRNYRVLFPESSRETLQVRDGVLLNMSSNNITGLILDSNDSAVTNTYHSQYLTLVPFTSTSGNNAAYQYGSYAYITTYSQGNYNNLTSSVTYVKPSVTSKPGLFGGFTQFELIVMFCLGLSILINFFGGLFRR